MAKGGYRPGAGRPKGSKVKCQSKKPTKGEIQIDIVTDAEAENLEPLAYMLKVMNDTEAENERRDRMAIAAAAFVHSRPTEGKGKKQDKEERAKAAGGGKFAPSRPPLNLVK